jgi:hypothetical protein
MPAGAVEQQDGLRTWRNLGADLGKVGVHRRRVGHRRDHRSTHTAGRADRAE